MKKSVKGQVNMRISDAIAWSLFALVFSSLLPQGLYREEMLLLYGIIISTSFLYMLRYHRNTIEAGDILLVILALSYAVSFSLDAADPRNALFQVLKVMLYLMVYIIVKLLIKDPGNGLKVNYAAVAGIFLLSLGAIIKYGIWGGFFDSFLLYVNSFASILAVSVVICIFLQANKQGLKKKNEIILDYILLINLICLFITKSRGGLIIIFILAVLISICYGEMLDKIYPKLFLYLISAIIMGTLLVNMRGFIFIFLVLALPILIIATQHTIMKRVYRYNTIKLFLLLIISAIGVYIFMKGNFYSRLINLNINDANIKARYLFYIDGLKILRDFPLFGAGGGGWLALYQQYQGHAYHTLEAHSSLIHYLVEGGIVGTIIIVLFVFLKWFWYIQARLRKQTTWFHDCAFIVTIGILAHSLIDIDLSYPAFNIILFVMFAILPDKEVMQLKMNRIIIAKIIPFIVLICFVPFSLGRIMTHSFFIDSADGLSKVESNKYESRFNTAVKLDPLNSEYYNLLAQLNINQGRIDSNIDKINEGLDNFNRSIELLPNFVDAYLIRARIYDELGREAEAIKNYEMAATRAPLKNNSYDLLINYYVTLGIRHKNESYFIEAVELIELLRNKMNLIEEERKQMWIGDYLGYSYSQCYNAGLAYYYLSKYPEGLKYFRDAKASSGYENLPPDKKEQIQGLIAIGESKTQVKPNIFMEPYYLAELENKLNNYLLQ